MVGKTEYEQHSHEMEGYKTYPMKHRHAYSFKKMENHNKVYFLDEKCEPYQHLNY